MQQSSQMIPMVPSFPPTNITTEQIQKCLDENKKLIMAILENQNLGKLAECAQYQSDLQKNLTYLAAIADVQPQPLPPATTPIPGAMTPQAMVSNPSSMQPPPSYFVQQNQQDVGLAQQIPPGIFPPRGPLQFGNMHQLHDPQHQLHQQAMQGHMGIRPMGMNHNNGLQQHPMHHSETALGANNMGTNESRGGNKQDGTDVSQSGADGLDGSAAKHGNGDRKNEGN